VSGAEELFTFGESALIFEGNNEVVKTHYT
jgi:hypothetical protein